jgi:hypothetical protein
MKGKRDRRVVDPDHSGCFSFGFPERKRKLREREREGVVEKERDWGGSHGEKERGSRLERRRRNSDSRGCGCHWRDFEDLGHGGPVCRRRPVFLPIAPLFLSLDPV